MLDRERARGLALTKEEDAMSKNKPEKVEDHIKESVHSFLLDPPDSLYQCGHLGALLVIAEEVLGLPRHMPPFAKAHKLCSQTYRALVHP